MIRFILEKLNIWHILCLFIFCVMCILCLTEWYQGHEDNVYEEIIEDIIKSRLGIEVELTPTNRFNFGGHFQLR